MENRFSQFAFWIAIIGLAAVYISGLFIDVMDVDAAQYASISLEMLMNKSYLQVKHWGNDYLDKPPLLFWLSCLSFKLFGVSTVAYKLPSFLVSLLGFYSIYRFAKIYYREETAKLAAIILASCQAMISMNNDVRTDAMLAGFVSFSFWQIAEYIRGEQLKNLVWSGIGIGLAMLAKGPIGFMIPLIAFGSDAALRRRFSPFLKWQWLVLQLIVAIVILPMCVGLYQQYSWIGFKFYFWTQSFGRLTGENRWHNDAGYLFLVHTFLWAFIPWTFLFVVALVRKLTVIFKQKFNVAGNDEYISFSALALTFIALSFSHYKLPHYIFVVTSLASVMTADFIIQLRNSKNLIWAKPVQGFILSGICVLGAVVVAWIFPLKSPFIMAVLIALVILAFLISFKKSGIEIASLLVIVAFGLMLHLHFYPALLEYQPSKRIAEYLKEQQVPSEKIYSYKIHSHALDFYAGIQGQILHSGEDVKIAGDSLWLLVKESDFGEIRQAEVPFTVRDSFETYSIANLRLEFLNPRTRASRINKVLLLEF